MVSVVICCQFVLLVLLFSWVSLKILVIFFFFFKALNQWDILLYIILFLWRYMGSSYLGNCPVYSCYKTALKFNKCYAKIQTSLGLITAVFITLFKCS